MKLNSLDKVITRLDTRRNKIKQFDERLLEMAAFIKARVRKSPETSNWAANVFGSMFHNMGISAFKTMDAQFTVSRDCTQCGTCEKICPRNNIKLTASGLAFSHNCELCHACIQLCPKFAIRHSNFDDNPRQYRNKEVRVSELFVN
jgi:ferredoxin